ncbi:hypothetical protein GQX74_010685 [Glossina fuscipes]|nr:hypothetical protein GQX74_010685 [Glossina fuscipes]
MRIFIWGGFDVSHYQVTSRITKYISKRLPVDLRRTVVASTPFKGALDITNVFSKALALKLNFECLLKAIMLFLILMQTLILFPHLLQVGAKYFSKQYSQYKSPFSSTKPISCKARRQFALTQMKCSGHHIRPKASSFVGSGLGFFRESAEAFPLVLKLLARWGGPPLAKRASNISDITLPASIIKLFVFVPKFILPIDSDNMTVASSSGARMCSSVSVLVGKAYLTLELLKALLDLRLGKVPLILPIFRAGSGKMRTTQDKENSCRVDVGTAVVVGAGAVNGVCITDCGAAKLVALVCGGSKSVKPAEARRLYRLLRFAASVTRATQSAHCWAYVLRRSACVLVSGDASRISLISSRSFNPACNIRCETDAISSSFNRGARIAANGFGGGPGAGERARSGKGDTEQRS